MSCRCNSSGQLQNHGQNQVHLLHALCIPLSSTRKRSKSCYDCSCRKNIEKILYAGKSKRAVFVKKYRRTQVSPTVFYIKHIKKQNKMLKVKCSFLNDKFFFFHLSVQKGAFHFTFVLLFFFYSFARKNAQISSHTSFWKKRRSAWSASSIESSVTSHPAFSSSSCSSSPCPNGTVWSSSP